MVICSKYHTEDSQILNATVPNFVLLVTWCPGFLHPQFGPVVKCFVPYYSKNLHSCQMFTAIKSTRAKYSLSNVTLTSDIVEGSPHTCVSQRASWDLFVFCSLELKRNERVGEQGEDRRQFGKIFLPQYNRYSD